MPVVELILGVAGQLQLTHILAEPKPVSRIVESGDLPDALEHPLGIWRPRHPEQITVSDQTAIAPRHLALERTHLLMHRNDTLALLRAEPTREDLAVIKSFPHRGRSSPRTDGEESIRCALDCQYINCYYDTQQDRGDG